MRECEGCGSTLESRFRFCPWCAAPQRRKLVEFFAASAAVDTDAGKALRVSRYLREQHVRFSVWNDRGEAEAALSLDELEAERLAAFLAPPAAERTLVDQLRDALRR